MSPKARHTPAAGHILSAQIHAFPWDSPLGGDTADCCWLLHPCPFPLRPGRQLLTTRLRSRIHLLDGGFGGRGGQGAQVTQRDHTWPCVHTSSHHIPAEKHCWHLCLLCLEGGKLRQGSWVSREQGWASRPPAASCWLLLPEHPYGAEIHQGMGNQDRDVPQGDSLNGCCCK